MNDNKFFIGQKVHHASKGFGLVVEITGDNWVGVEFEENIYGHDCDGKGKNGHCWRFPSNILNLVPVEEEEEPLGKIKWYYKGKLEENKIFEGVKEIGKKVKIRDDSVWRSQAYGRGGDGYGVIIWFDQEEDDEDPDNGLPYHIKWSNGFDEDYARIDFDFIDDEPEEPEGKIKWYYKGELKENKIFEGKEEIGKKVKMRNDSIYRWQAYENGGDGQGVILDFDEFEVVLDDGLPYKIKWSNGHKNGYSINDFEFIEDEPVGKVKWYHKGKLEESIHNDVNYEVGYKVTHKRHPEFGIGVIKKILPDGDAVIDFENLSYEWDGSLGLGYYEIVEDNEPIGKVKWYNKGKLEEHENWWKDEDKILILPKLEEVIWERNWDKKYYSLIGRVFTVCGYSLGDYIIQDGDNYFRIPTDCAVPPDSEDVHTENKPEKVRWYHKGKLEKLTTKFEMFEAVKWYHKGKLEKDESEDIPEINWDEEPEYFYGEISVDNIDITPCTITFNVVKRFFDGIVLWEDDEEIEDSFDNLHKIIILTIPDEKADGADSNLRYVYRKDADKKESLDILILLVRKFTANEKTKARFTHILKTFGDDIISFEPTEKIVNLI